MFKLGKRFLTGSAFACIFATSAWCADLNIALGSNLNSLDPTVTTIGEEYVVSGLVFNGLMRTEPDGKIVPDLAKTVTGSKDLKTWDVTLRDGVKFHHGKILTSDDVIFTFKRIMDPATGSAGRSDLSIVDQMERVDDLTVRFHLNVPFASFPDLLTGRQMRIVPSDRADKLKTEPSGTGPFRFVSYSIGDVVRLERNPDYFDADHVKLDHVNLRIIPEAASRIAALKAGDIDMIWNLPLEMIPETKGNAQIKIDSRPSSTWDAFVLNNSVPPFNDVRVRRAFLLALDKKLLVRLALNDEGAPVHVPIAPTDPAFNKDIGFTPNPLEAKRLLGEAGYPNGFNINMIVPVGRPARERLGVAAQQMLQQVGIKVTLQRMPYNRYSEIAGNAPLYVDGFFARTLIDSALYPWLHSKGSWNSRMWHYASPQVDELLDKARVTTDPVARAELYKKVQSAVTTDVPGVFAYVTNVATAYRTTIKGYQTNPFLWVDLLDVEKE